MICGDCKTERHAQRFYDVDNSLCSTMTKFEGEISLRAHHRVVSCVPTDPAENSLPLLVPQHSRCYSCTCCCPSLRPEHPPHLLAPALQPLQCPATHPVRAPGAAPRQNRANCGQFWSTRPGMGGPQPARHKEHGPLSLVRHCTVQYCPLLNCILYCIVLYCAVQCCTVLCCTVLYITALCCTVLYSYRSGF